MARTLEHQLFDAFVQHHGIITSADWSGVRGQSIHTPPYEAFLTSAKYELATKRHIPGGAWFMYAESHLLVAPVMPDDQLCQPQPGDTHRVDYGRLRFDGTISKGAVYLAHLQGVALRCQGCQRELADRLIQAWQRERALPQRDAVAVPERLISALTPEFVTDLITVR